MNHTTFLPSILLAAAAVMLLPSCSPRIYPAQQVDSVRVEIRERIDTQLVTVTIEKEVERIVTRDTSSHLENSYAKSDAVVSGGYLHHSLESKPQIIEKEVYIPVRDTLIVEKQAETIVKEVERSLSKWQRFTISLGYCFMGVILAALAWGIFKIVRRL